MQKFNARNFGSSLRGSKPECTMQNEPSVTTEFINTKAELQKWITNSSLKHF